MAVVANVSSENFIYDHTGREISYFRTVQSFMKIHNAYLHRHG